MDVERVPLSSEQQGVLQSYRAFLEQARYARVEERVREAENCLRALWPQTKPLPASVLAGYGAQLSKYQAANLFAFRRYLVHTGWLLEERADPLPRRIGRLPEPTAGWLGRYVRQMRRQNLASGTVARRVWVIVCWLQRCSAQEQAELARIDRDTVERLIEWAQDAGLAPGSLNSQLSDLHHFFLFLQREGLLAGSPILRQHWLREPEALPRAMAPAEVARFLAVLEGARDRSLFLLLLRTGMRGGEAVGLEVGDLDLERRMLHIRHGTAKMAKSRVVYFSEDAAGALRDWLAERGEAPTARLFFGWPRFTLTRGTINWRFKRYLALAGIERPYTAHSLRHTFASELLNAGVSLMTVSA